MHVMFTSVYRAGLLLWVLASGITVASAQVPHQRIVAGVHLSILDQHALSEKPGGWGGRFGYLVTNRIAIEAEVNRFPLPGAVSLSPATQVLSGARAGHHFAPIGLYGKVRPGFICFDSSSLGSKGAVNIGGVVKMYMEQHLALRLDVGSTMVFYGNSAPVAQGRPVPSGTRHQLQVSEGIGIWF